MKLSTPAATLIKTKSSKYAINVITERCKECGICVAVCPTKVLARGDSRNRRGYRYVVPAYPDKCIGCKMCEYSCPDFAIFVEAG
ncbi:MAG: 4Fe-4S binding protein [Sulfolobales archaeon]|nr:4Fe-4S binding protein [Sulfolobales archaeon]MDW8082552.1 4Fe-4S binding protein [Sulfolobales archaeon]